jgi:hypothetical protein
MHAKTAAELAGRYGIDWRPNIDRHGYPSYFGCSPEKGCKGKLDPTQVVRKESGLDSCFAGERPVAIQLHFIKPIACPAELRLLAMLKLALAHPWLRHRETVP